MPPKDKARLDQSVSALLQPARAAWMNVPAALRLELGQALVDLAAALGDMIRLGASVPNADEWAELGPSLFQLVGIAKGYGCDGHDAIEAGAMAMFPELAPFVAEAKAALLAATHSAPDAPAGVIGA